MSAGLVSTRVETEVEHACALVLGCDDVGAPVGIWEVVTEELPLVLLEDIDSVCL